MIIGNHFYISGFALSLVLKQRLGTTRKWPVDLLHCITDSSRAKAAVYNRRQMCGEGKLLYNNNNNNNNGRLFNLFAA